MPRYDYYCPENQKTLEVIHPMSETVKTWERLCELAGETLGDTATSAHVERVLNRDDAVGDFASVDGADNLDVTLEWPQPGLRA